VALTRAREHVTILVPDHVPTTTLSLWRLAPCVRVCLRPKALTESLFDL
jgi:hypothetical protein